MAQRISRAVDTGRLAVPQPDDAVVGRIGAGRGQLAAHDGRRGLIFVDSR